LADASAIPEVAPVITATLPSNLPMNTLLLLRKEQLNADSLIDRAFPLSGNSSASRGEIASQHH
jgi:hypothetical protein